jgi:low temperature requirement protein LtrA
MYENRKMTPVETILRMEEGCIKENDGWGVTLIYIVSSFVNVTMYPQYNNNITKNFKKKLKKKNVIQTYMCVYTHMLIWENAQG